MPLTATNRASEVDAFGVRFTMEDRGKLVRCHVFRSAVDRLEDHPTFSDAELLDRFQKSRGVFQRRASVLYDAGHRNPWIDMV